MIIANLLGQLRHPEFAPIRTAAPEKDGVKNIDYNTPVYYSVPADPVYTITCRATFAVCPLEGKQMRIPSFAEPEHSGGAWTGPGASDHHLAIIDTASGLEHDFWQATIPSGTGGTFPIGFGSSGPLSSQGIGIFAADQAQFALTIGNTRAPDLFAGVIPHAIAFMVPCANNYRDTGRGVYPAGPGSDQLCKAPGVQPYYGMRLQLAMTDEQIAALAAPDYVKTIFTALAHYGAYVSDTGNGAEGDGEMALRAESGLTYTQIGLPDPWAALAERNGIRPWGDAPNSYFSFPLSMDGLDIRPYLRVIAPCVTARTC